MSKNKDLDEKELDKLVSNDEMLNKRAVVSKMLDSKEVTMPDKGKAP